MFGGDVRFRRDNIGVDRHLLGGSTLLVIVVLGSVPAGYRGCVWVSTLPGVI